MSRRIGQPFVTTALSVYVRPEDERGVFARWITPSVGIGYAVDGAGKKLSVDARAEMVVERLDVDIDDPSSARTDSAGRWMGGVRLGSDLSWTPFEPVGLLLAAEGMARFASTDVRVRDTVVGTVPVLDYALLGGFRARWR